MENANFTLESLPITWPSTRTQPLAIHSSASRREAARHPEGHGGGEARQGATNRAGRPAGTPLTAPRHARRCVPGTSLLYFPFGTFSQSARNFFRPMSVSGCFTSCLKTE